MSQTDGDRLIAARLLAEELFRKVGGTATMSLNDLKAAVGSIDDTMDALPAALTAGQTIKTNFIQRLPEPFKSASNAQQKAVALMAWAMKETGLI